MKKLYILTAIGICMAFAGCAESSSVVDDTTAHTTGNSVCQTTTAPVVEEGLSDGVSVSNSSVITTAPEDYQTGTAVSKTGKYYVFTDENGIVIGTGIEASDAEELGVATGGVIGSYIVVTDDKGVILGTSVDGNLEGIGGDVVSGTTTVGGNSVVTDENGNTIENGTTNTEVSGIVSSQSGTVSLSSGSSSVVTTTPKVTTTKKTTTTAPKTTTIATTKTTTATTLYTEITSKTMYVKSAVNVRSNPDQSSTKLGTLSAGASVKVIGESGNWYAISYNGQTAFVSKNYISSTKPSTTTTTTTTKVTTTTKKTTTTAKTTTKVTTTTSSSSGSGSSTLPYDEATVAFINEVVRLTNEFRAENGVDPLTINIDLTAVAMVRAEEITEVFDHTRPDGTSAFTAFDEGGFVLGTNSWRRAENIAYGYSSAEAVVEAWKNSTTGHRENMLNAEFNIIGVGVVKKGNVYYWTQEFVNYG